MKQFFNKIINFFRRIFSQKNSNFLHYITSGEALPMPLESELEAETIKEFSLGNLDAKRKLIEHNLRLVVYIAKKFDNTGVDPEDLISIGTIGLIKAVASFDAAKNIKLATYASRCIENEILMHLRKIVKIKSEVSLDEPLNVDFEGNELLMSDILGTEVDLVSKNIENKTEHNLLWAAINKLNKREKVIMQMRFGLAEHEEKTQKEVADLLGISQSYISRLEKKIFFRLKRDIAKVL
ncbi:MAG: RNA polymerase sporulation sigma factor SigE [Firmicutes bacterium]|nr:RNA polymerase sporulation sigma factor SigE [Bacillota bacterium]